MAEALAATAWCCLRAEGVVRWCQAGLQRGKRSKVAWAAACQAVGGCAAEKASGYQAPKTHLEKGRCVVQ